MFLLPSGGSKALGPVGWNPFIAQSIICLFSISTDFEVSVSSLSGQAMKALPARLLAAYEHVKNIYDGSSSPVYLQKLSSTIPKRIINFLLVLIQALILKLQFLYLCVLITLNFRPIFMVLWRGYRCYRCSGKTYRNSSAYWEIHCTISCRELNERK